MTMTHLILAQSLFPPKKYIRQCECFAITVFPRLPSTLDCWAVARLSDRARNRKQKSEENTCLEVMRFVTASWNQCGLVSEPNRQLAQPGMVKCGPARSGPAGCFVTVALLVLGGVCFLKEFWHFLFKNTCFIQFWAYDKQVTKKKIRATNSRNSWTEKNDSNHKT